MNPKVIMIIATGEKEKALVGLVYAQKALAQRWMDDAMVILFGPSEKLIISDTRISQIAKDLALDNKLIACKYIADQENISEEIEALGIRLDYVGSLITDYINRGFIPMVF